MRSATGYRWMVAAIVAACGGDPSDSDTSTGTTTATTAASSSTDSPTSTTANTTTTTNDVTTSSSSTTTSSSDDSSTGAPDTTGTTTGVPGDEVSDEFEGADLDAGWTIVNGANFTYEVSQGALHITPTTNTLWYMETNTGALMYKLVSGDFRLTTAVRARSASNPDAPVGPVDFQFGGIMVRDPAAPPENYVFNVLGDRGPLQVETKTTDDDASTVHAEDWPSGDAQLRICRVGATFHLYSRPIDGGAWQVATPFGPPYERPDLPDTLQVGPIAYAWTDAPDLRASFDYVRFAPVTDESECTLD